LKIRKNKLDSGKFSRLQYDDFDRDENRQMNTTPVSLLERLRHDPQPEAWTRFVELYTPLLFGYAHKLRLQEPDAADLVQEVFVKLFRAVPTFSYDRHRSFRAWLRTVLLNCYRDLHRRRAVPTVGADALGQLPDPDTLGDLDEAEYRRHLVQRTLRLIEADFEPATWKAFCECNMHGRLAAEVAAELGKSVGAVHAANFRVLTRLRQELRGLLD
jgi:RNA polymerase sigma-70 factor (ECF subfamily)